MIVNVFWDDEECAEYADVIYIPDIITDIENKQLDFFKWLFCKTNNHPYWIVIDGEKKGCQYGLDAFLEWLNCNYLTTSCSKAYAINICTKDFDRRNLNLYF